MLAKIVLIGLRRCGILTAQKNTGQITPWLTHTTYLFQDKGGNAISTYAGSGTVSVAMYSTFNSAVLYSTGAGGLTNSFFSGVASFSGLYINEGGGPYVLKFTTDLSLAGATSQTTFPFTVGVGAASSMVFVDEPAYGTATGGAAFTRQPELKVVDAGGNVLTSDSTSSVAVSIIDNPSDGTLSPVANTAVVLVSGVATFNALAINYAGLSYRLQYTLVGSTVTVSGGTFDVITGPPSTLSVQRVASDAWAGGQPFQVQPYVNLYDNGLNTIEGDSATAVACMVVPSLAVNEGIVVKTSDAGTVNVTNVRFSPETMAIVAARPQSALGPGDNIEIEVVFSAEVTASYTSLVPYLNLTLTMANGPALPVGSIWRGKVYHSGTQK